MRLDSSLVIPFALTVNCLSFSLLRLVSYEEMNQRVNLPKRFATRGSTCDHVVD